jgi:hypothetical protein
VHALDTARAYIERLKSQYDPVILESLTDVLDVMPRNTFVISFSKDGDVLSQWRGYCRAGGYSMELATAKLRQFAEEQRFVLVKCTYNRAEQEGLIQNLILEAVREFPHYIPTGKFPPAPMELDRARFFAAQWFFPKMQRLASAMKDPAFKEEQEWRLIGALFQPLPPLDVRPGGSLLIPYEIFKLESGTPATIEGVITRVLVRPDPEQELAVFGIARMQQCGYITGLRIETSSIP